MREHRVKMIRHIDDNDPSLSEIWIGTDEDEYEHTMPNDRHSGANGREGTSFSGQKVLDQ